MFESFEVNPFFGHNGQDVEQDVPSFRLTEPPEGPLLLLGG